MWVFQINKMFHQILESGKFVVYATGNHDYWISEYHFEQFKSHEKFVLFCTPTPKTSRIDFGEETAYFHGVGYEVNQPNRSIITKMCAPVSGGSNIGLIHGVINGKYPEGKGAYYPMSENQLIGLNYDYTALGHLHEELLLEEYAGYSGCILPSRLQDVGLKSALLIEVKKGNTVIEKVDLGAISFFDIVIDVTASSIEEYLKQIDEETSKVKLKDSFIYRIIFDATISFRWESVYELEVAQRVNLMLGKELMYRFKNDFNYKNTKDYMDLPDYFKKLCLDCFLEVRDEITSGSSDLTLLSSRQSITEHLKSNENTILESLFDLWRKVDDYEN
jgi:DNA repair exonuclease SbcCD nuclease subunit